ncbi:VOC family protein [Gordonia sp. OPL2]|uniref:VOC family protein n=1 Tax=Gordonia sp. OPL2 TaxID=2486274 RepID=UPI001655B685|nr:VOC family protein [Gordonia sp. OPL2]RPA20112.1 VOC family protein [Gordonia sp. OPL2]
MSLSVAMITVDTTDPVPLATWWAAQTDGSVVAENDGFFVVVTMASGTVLSFQKVDDPTPGKNRIHLDLTADDPTAEVERLVRAGATVVAERQMAGFAWVTMADPDGNEFCVSGAHEAAGN